MIDFAFLEETFVKLLSGIPLMLKLAFSSVAIGLFFAIALAFAMRSRVRPLAWLAEIYVFVFRGTPLLVQIFLVYYGLGQFEGVRASALWPILREPYWCAIIAFALNTGAYTAEILRGAIQAVPVGEVEAANAFGMSRALSLRRIILPRAVRIALPAYGNEVILMLKGSALASTITLLDLTGMARTIIARTYMPVEIFLAAGLIYLAITFVFVQLFRLLERRLSRHVAAAH